MTLSEFKAWFEGFSEGIETAPTADQFAKIKAKVALIDGTVTTYPIFVDRYIYPQWRWTGAWGGTPYITTSGSASAQATGGMSLMASASAALGRQADDTLTDAEWANKQAAGWLDSHTAMRELGRAEALN